MPKSIFTYDEDVYTPQGLKNIDTKSLRKEYSRLRSIAVKRLKRFDGTEYTTSQIYKNNIDKFDVLKNIKSERELRYLLVDLERFLSAETSTVMGQKKFTKFLVEKYQEKGLTFVDKTNVRRFSEFVDVMRARYGAALKYLPNIGEIFDEVEYNFMEEAGRNDLPADKLNEAFTAWLKKTDLDPYRKGFEIPSIKFERGR